MLTIKRVYNDNFTIGKLVFEDKVFYTLELPYKDNQTNISCIPEGIYKIRKHYSPKFKECFAINNVVNRTNILIHAGNYTKDTHGCILVGLKVGDGSIFESRKALKILLNILPEEEELKIC
ncbi:MAG TPA: DUF5675 family protein [Rickettsiales bacterium]|nr:DUF5675 family protein [Rickettsiales bacterium]